MKRIKRFFVIVLGVVTFSFVKIASVFAAEPINTDIWGMSTECLYGVQRPSQSADIGTVLGKIALFVLLPLCIVALITVGIVALVKTSKKKKQAQNVNPQNQNGNTNNPNM